MNIKNTSQVLNQEGEIPSARIVSLRELPTDKETGANLLNGNLSLISGVKVNLEVIVGSAEISVAELFQIKSGSVLPLQQLHHAPLSVRLDGKIIALGTLVVVGDNFGVCITEILPHAATTA